MNLKKKHVFINEILVKNSIMSQNSWMDVVPVSEHCAFVYNTGYNEDYLTFIKTVGFIFAGTKMYKFHILANSIEPIVNDIVKIKSFEQVALEWMSRTNFVGDNAYTLSTQEGKANETKSVVTFIIEDVIRKMKDFFFEESFEDDFKKYIVYFCEFVYCKNKFEPNDEFIDYLVDLLGRINNRKINRATMKKMLNKNNNTAMGVEEFLDSEACRKILEKFIIFDCAAKLDINNSITKFFYSIQLEIIQLILYMNNIDFKNNAFYRHFVTEEKCLILELFEEASEL